MNELLFWMSIRGGGGIGTFQTKVAEFEGATRSGPAGHRLAEWNLSLLGHGEFREAADGGWRIAPPVLAAADLCGPYQAILCGARTPELVRRLQDAAYDRFSIRAQADGPDIIEIQGTSAAELIDIARKARLPLQWNAPLAVLLACVPPREQVLKPVALPTGAWVVSRFSKSRMEWTSTKLEDARNASAGLFRFKSDQGSAYILKEAGAVMATDPSIGKYRIFKRRNRVLGYNASLAEISLPITCRPPALVERAFVISSGDLPTIRDGRIIYRSVRRRVAEMAALILGQRLN